MAISSRCVAQIAVPADQNIPATKPTENSAAHGKISQSLDAASDGTEPALTGDMILDDVIGVIRRRGSVLRGSILDEQRIKSSVIPPAVLNGTLKDTPSAFSVAEQLLAAARQLESLPGTEDSIATRRVLIRSMRREATMLLVDAISKDGR